MKRPCMVSYSQGEMDNTASSDKRSAAAAKCQAISLDDNGTENQPQIQALAPFSSSVSFKKKKKTTKNSQLVILLQKD